ncbi:hypothetical protein D9756_004950 [Leucocoprinus leucothites]|uniref:Uncharacterized protein n=1 Tax=Leucocoprinus leucothites TaxID=201217 RepID=A0A8H5LKF0_9AGAR|nr:hypothetical protein D9756_004950 [Leucoagaricus leucothites]
MSRSSASSISTRGLLGRVPLKRLRDNDTQEYEKRLSAYESYQLASTTGQAFESPSWEVDVTRALIQTSLDPKKASGRARGNNIPPVTRRPHPGALHPGGFHSQDTHTNSPLVHYYHDCHPQDVAKIPQRSRSPFASLNNTIGSMSSAASIDSNKVAPQSASSAAQAPASGTASSTQHVDKGKGRPIITPASLTSRRQAPTTRSFSSLPPPQISPTTIQSGPSFLAPPTLAVIGPTPEASPITPSSPTRRAHHKSTPDTPSGGLRSHALEVPQIQKSWSSGSGKRKAEGLPDPEGSTTPPKEQKEHRATFAPEPRTHRSSTASLPPSSYHRKRARLSLPSDGSNPPSRPSSRNATLSSVQESPNAKTTGSWSSKKSGRGSITETFRRAASASTSTHAHARNDSWSRSHSQTGHGSTPPTNTLYQQQSAAPSRRSLSQASIPISALISPHAPSIAHSGKFHMRDPRRPAPVRSTPWSLSFPSRVESGESRWERGSWVERGGSPLCSWLFFIGFVIFPMWWATWFVGVPKTRRLDDGGETGGREKGVVLDDPQVEYDARSWRKRCRVMSGVSLVTYVPFIILVIVFAR